MSRTPHTRHLKHRHLDRTRYSRHFLGWLNEQASLLKRSASVLFSWLATGVSPQEIESFPGNTALPTITGTTAQGSTLSTTDGTWAGGPTFTYQWLKDAVAISGANAATYLLGAGDVGGSITVAVTGTNAAGTTTAISTGVGPIT